VREGLEHSKGGLLSERAGTGEKELPVGRAPGQSAQILASYIAPCALAHWAALLQSALPIQDVWWHEAWNTRCVGAARPRRWWCFQLGQALPAGALERRWQKHGTTAPAPPRRTTGRLGGARDSGEVWERSGELSFIDYRVACRDGPEAGGRGRSVQRDCASQAPIGRPTTMRGRQWQCRCL
jgi:hypothetical protein